MKIRVRRRTAAIVTMALVTAGAATAVALSGAASRTPAASTTGAIDGKVHTIRLQTAGTSADLPAQSTQQFSLLGVEWDQASARLHATAKIRTRSAATGAWSAWRRLTVSHDVPDGTGHERARRGATAPLWTGPSDGVDVRVHGRRTLPTGLSVVLIDPGSRRHGPTHTHGHNHTQHGATDSASPTAPQSSSSGSPSDSPSPTAPRTSAPASASDSPSPTAPQSSAPASASDSPSPTAPQSSAPASASDSPSPTAPRTSPSASPSDSPSPTPSPSISASATATASVSPTTSAAPRPAIVSRAQWGADESLVASPPAYGTAVKVVFVHHTDTGNSYSCGDSPSLVRGIFMYHVETNGWNDIGYNFLVDKCGTLFEGRAGGVDRPVIGAHAYGFNTNSAGVAVLGTFTDAAPSNAAMATVARVAAWKLGLDGGDPTGSATLTEGVKDGNFPYGSPVTFKTISGHRDANSTACPGQMMYEQLGAIRTMAADAG